MPAHVNGTIPATLRGTYTMSLLFFDDAHGDVEWHFNVYGLMPGAQPTLMASVKKRIDRLLISSSRIKLEGHLRQLFEREVGSFILDGILAVADVDNMQAGDEVFIDGTRVSRPVQPGPAPQYAKGGIVRPQHRPNVHPSHTHYKRDCCNSRLNEHHAPGCSRKGMVEAAIESVARRAKPAGACPECKGTGHYESPISGAKSPCSMGCKPTT